VSKSKSKEKQFKDNNDLHESKQTSNVKGAKDGKKLFMYGVKLDKEKSFVQSLNRRHPKGRRLAGN